MIDMLIVEDNKGLLNILKEAFETENYSLTLCESAEEAKEIIDKIDFDIVITDLKLPGEDGISILKFVKQKNPETDVILITAYGTIDKAVEAMKIGAADFITKPFSLDYIRLLVAKIIANKKLKEENKYLKNQIKREIIGESKSIKEILELVEKISNTDANVLISGESGTGKELIAEKIHNLSKRSNFPLIKVNCAALAPGVLESELFGHEKGAFTDAYYSKKGRFELADKGSIFLDEIGDMPVELQVKILRVIQDKIFERVGGEKSMKVDVRIIAATHQDLKEKILNGTFREDLYYRLNVVEIKVPPLRERKEDIPLLVDYFIKKYADYGEFKVKGISKKALDILLKYDYPGNIRELENLIQRILVICRREYIEADDIPYEIKIKSNNAVLKDNFESKIKNFEKKIILEALHKTKGNKMKAAELLKINRATLMAKMKKLKIK
jgi:DNA-binding NtrC family response regulator